MKKLFYDKVGKLVEHGSIITMGDGNIERMKVINDYLCWPDGEIVKNSDNLHKYWRVL